MKQIRDLLALNHAQINKELTEERQSDDIQELIEKWQDVTNNYHFEGDRGARAFEALVQVLGYGSADDFFSDNSGAYEALLEWIGSQHNSEWISALQDATADGEGEDKYDDDDGDGDDADR